MGAQARAQRWVPEDNFANRIRQLRASLGLSQDEMAALCGLASATWSTWERGRHPQRMHEVVRQIAEATGVDEDWLMWGSKTGSSRPLEVVGSRPSLRPVQQPAGQMELHYALPAILVAV